MRDVEKYTPDADRAELEKSILERTADQFPNDEDDTAFGASAKGGIAQDMQKGQPHAKPPMRVD